MLLCSQILGFVAKGSYGPILKVRDISKDRTYAVKVSSAIIISTIAALYESIKHVFVSSFSLLLTVGATKVRDLEAWSAAAVQRRSHHSGTTV